MKNLIQKKIFNNDTIQPINKIINIMKNYE